MNVRESDVNDEKTQRFVLEDKERYQKSREDLLGLLASHPQEGLSAEEVLRRQAVYGPNELKAEEKTPFWQKLLDQFKDFMIIILIVAALISGFVGEWADAALIIAIVLVNAILGILQEGRAEKAIAALQKMSAPSARVLRDGSQSMIKASDLVPGDVVILDAGDIVPADLRLLESSNLKVEEASLTGESVPVEKDASFEAAEDLGIGDRHNLLYASTSVTYGNGKAVVLGIAEDTEVGRIADRLKGIVQDATPLQQSLNHLGKVLGVICILVCVLVFVVGMLQGGDAMRLFMTAVSLAVAAIPEGLPAVVTIVLALGMNRMAEEHAIVKRLLAVETLGSIDTICTDKTGTLTQNEMTVTQVYVGGQSYEVTGTGYEPKGRISLAGSSEAATLEAPFTRLLEICALCNEAELSHDPEASEGKAYRILGDPTEGALLTLAAKASVHREALQARYRYVTDFPFDSKRKMMSVCYEGFPEGAVSLTKGAPDILLGFCSHELTETGPVPLTEARRAEILEQNSAYASQALRVLAAAYQVHPDKHFDQVETAMVFVGLTGMIDPSRPEAKKAIAVCHKAGIRVVMITGDYLDTAVAIAKDLNLMQAGDGVLTGQELEAMDDQALEERCETISVYARVSPEHKVRIVTALRKRGHATSMTGDGVNDAPALKQADIGVAMGITGTEVAKSSAEMILTDDNFATIVSAVREGRIIYSNIRKFVGFLLSCNVGEILVIFITNLILGPEYAPLLPIQLLWLNLVTDSFPALALGQEKGEENIMEMKPRGKEEKIINREMIASIAAQSLAIFVAVFVAFQLGRFFYPDNLTNEAGDFLTTATGDLAVVEEFQFFDPVPLARPSNGARTYAFVTLIVAELLRAFSCRSERYSVFRLGVFSNKTMNKSILLAFALMLIVVYVPALDRLFHTISPSLRDWGIMGALAFIPFGVGELFKKFYHRDRSKPSSS